MRALLLALLLWTHPALACTPAPLASVPVAVRGGFPFIAAAIGGQAVTLLLDTGAAGTLLLPEGAARLGLPPEGETYIVGTGGSRVVPVVTMPEMRIGSVRLSGGQAAVASLPADLPSADPPVAGVLGASLLAAYDVELDLGSGRLTLFASTGCPPWPGAEAALQPLPDGGQAVPAEANGVPLLAVPDTGTRQTLLSEAAGRQLRLGGPVIASTARGLDGRPVPMRRATLRALRVGGDVAAGLPVLVTDFRLEPVGVLLGMDWFARRRVWMSYAAGLIRIRPVP